MLHVLVSPIIVHNIFPYNLIKRIIIPLTSSVYLRSRAPSQKLIRLTDETCYIRYTTRNGTGEGSISGGRVVLFSNPRETLEKSNDYKIMSAESSGLDNRLTDFLFSLLYYKVIMYSVYPQSLYKRYCIEDLITPHYWLCSVLIILTNQWLPFCEWK